MASSATSQDEIIRPLDARLPGAALWLSCQGVHFSVFLFVFLCRPFDQKNISLPLIRGLDWWFEIRAPGSCRRYMGNPSITKPRSKPPIAGKLNESSTFRPSWVCQPGSKLPFAGKLRPLQRHLANDFLPSGKPFEHDLLAFPFTPMVLVAGWPGLESGGRSDGSDGSDGSDWSDPSLEWDKLASAMTLPASWMARTAANFDHGVAGQPVESSLHLLGQLWGATRMIRSEYKHRYLYCGLSNAASAL